MKTILEKGFLPGGGDPEKRAQLYFSARPGFKPMPAHAAQEEIENARRENRIAYISYAYEGNPVKDGPMCEIEIDTKIAMDAGSIFEQRKWTYCVLTSKEVPKEAILRVTTQDRTRCIQLGPGMQRWSQLEDQSRKAKQSASLRACPLDLRMHDTAQGTGASHRSRSRPPRSKQHRLHQ